MRQDLESCSREDTWPRLGKGKSRLEKGKSRMGKRTNSGPIRMRNSEQDTESTIMQETVEPAGASNGSRRRNCILCLCLIVLLMVVLAGVGILVIKTFMNNDRVTEWDNLSYANRNTESSLEMIADAELAGNDLEWFLDDVDKKETKAEQIKTEWAKLCGIQETRRMDLLLIIKVTRPDINIGDRVKDLCEAVPTKLDPNLDTTQIACLLDRGIMELQLDLSTKEDLQFANQYKFPVTKEIEGTILRSSRIDSNQYLGFHYHYRDPDKMLTNLKDEKVMKKFMDLSKTNKIAEMLLSIKPDIRNISVHPVFNDEVTKLTIYIAFEGQKEDKAILEENKIKKKISEFISEEIKEWVGNVSSPPHDDKNRRNL